MRRWMSPYVAAAVIAAALMLGAFGVVELLQLPLLTDPAPVFGEGTAVAAMASVALLASDAVLPIPSSILMVANGGLFGAVAGSTLSVLGAMGSALLAFYLGRRGGRLLALVSAQRQVEAAERFFERWGALAVTLSRPLPILAETIAMLAGAGRMELRRFCVSALVGNVPICVAYGVAGAAADRYVGYAAIALPAAALLAAGCFGIARTISARREPPG
ncbi:MAG TPA: VTT domain-containing protein [Kofleriaceae bacterium]|nr:VTT domain-containing protein [Kofleriaceae bacterium]